jgi:hypothetical protein
MSLCEDFYYDIYYDIHAKGISEEFYKQLDKMKFQDKHRYKSMKDRWEYAYNKITRSSKEKID